ncbi:MAG TPA: GntR family transcriptional regulator [Candidatus Onthovicinus excrementipullorum]|nr:GntR family transcriptional regulator [Candidatus Onthovicinus excrementipullorum]
MPWDLDENLPIYLQLTDELEKKIINGTYPPGSRLPAVRELAAEAGVNPNTMQRALTQMENSGLIYTQRTSGRFLTDDREKIERLRRDAARQRIEKFLRDMRELGIEKKEVCTMIDALKEEEA